MTLRQKLFLAFFFVVIIPIIMLGMIIIELIITRSDENIANVVEHELVMTHNYYQYHGESIKQSLQQSTILPYTLQAIQQNDQEFLQQLFI